MADEMRKQRMAAATKALDEVQAAVYALLRPLGFRRHGRVLHRFVSGDISQVVAFRRGMAYQEQTHLVWVEVGIRVPECQLRSFRPETPMKAFYDVSQCNMAYVLGEQSKRKTGAYDLRKPTAPIIEDITGRLRASVLPMFEVLASREAILARRREFPQMCLGHLVLLEHAMIYGRRGDLDRAAALFGEHYRTCGVDDRGTPIPDAARAHREYLRELAARLQLPLNDECPEA